ncbi:hypothetical protein BH10PSE19_BH10PSE19_00920 [soil metagenome]
MDIEFLKNTPCYALFGPAILDRMINLSTIKKFPAQQPIFQEGDYADAFYIVLDGDIRIYTRDVAGNKIVLARLEKGDYFGEQAGSLSPYPHRIASAEALTVSKTYHISREILLDINNTHKKMYSLLQNKLHENLTDKLFKLVEPYGQKIQFSELLKDTQQFERHQIIFYQGNRAEHLYILLSGSIELRQYDAEHRILNLLTLGIGEVFGNEKSQENNSYSFTAVAKEPVNVIAIPRTSLHAYMQQIPQLGEYFLKFAKQRQYSNYGQAYQFRGDYMELPAFITLLLLKDKREILCEQTIQSYALSIKTLGAEELAQAISFRQSPNNQRELHLNAQQQLIGLTEIGEWDDTNTLLEIIVAKHVLSKDELTLLESKGTLASLQKSQQDTFVCTCMRVTSDEITRAIKYGCQNFEAIRIKTGAATVCGSCRPAIYQLLGDNVWMPCCLKEVITHSAEVRTLRFYPLEPVAIVSRPGQHIVLRANIENNLVRRSYTLTSNNATNYFEITIKCETGGIFSQWIFEVATEDSLMHVAGPYGDFIFNDNSAAICFAGGIGITPFIAFIRTMLAKGNKNSIFIDYSTKIQNNFVFRDELEQATIHLSNAHINFRETSIQGRITSEEINYLLIQFPKAHIYICGPIHYEESLLEILHNANIPNERIHVEQFLQAACK